MLLCYDYHTIGDRHGYAEAIEIAMRTSQRHWQGGLSFDRATRTVTIGGRNLTRLREYGQTSLLAFLKPKRLVVESSNIRSISELDGLPDLEFVDLRGTRIREFAGLRISDPQSQSADGGFSV